MKTTIKTIIKNILFYLPFFLSKHTILLESTPDYSDNTKYFFEELLRRKINEKYKIYWIVQNKKKFEDKKIKNVAFCNRHSFKYELLHFSAKYIIDSNTFIPIIRKNQFRIHLGHGCPIKLTYEYSSQVGKLTYTTVLSPFFKQFFSELFAIPETKIKALGLPRNDGFFNNKHCKLFPNIKHDKVIIWMPTYRNHKNQTTNSVKTGINFPYGVPCIETDSDLEVVNSVLKKENIILVLKLHPVEDTSKISRFNYSNIKLFDEIALQSELQFYDILKEFDGLITDYSSVYYDYLLARKPIGLAIPDLESYSKSCNLISKKYTDAVKGNYIYNLNDLVKFIKIVASGNDPAKNDMIWALNHYHSYQDGNSSKRVVDLLMKEMENNK